MKRSSSRASKETARPSPAGLQRKETLTPRSGGRPLSEAERGHVEPHFGHDFSRVRIHHDGAAAESARAARALAYTVGDDIVFAPSRYAPDSASGRQLLRHELAHVVQQREGRVPGAGASSAPLVVKHAALEREADSWGQRATAAPPRTAPGVLGKAGPGVAPTQRVVQLAEDPAAPKPDATAAPASTPLDEAKKLLAETPSTSAEKARWILEAADQGFVTFEDLPGGYPRKNLEGIRDEQKVGNLEAKADVPILAVEVTLVKARISRWVASDGKDAKGSIRYGSMATSNTGAARDAPHGTGYAIDINNLNMAADVSATIQVLKDLDKSVHSKYGLGFPFEGDFFDAAYDLRTLQAQAEAQAVAAGDPAPTTLTVDKGLKRFTTKVFKSTATLDPKDPKKWVWKDTAIPDLVAESFLKSKELKDTIADLRKAGFSLTIFPDNPRHMHLARH